MVKRTVWKNAFLNVLVGFRYRTLIGWVYASPANMFRVTMDRDRPILSTHFYRTAQFSQKLYLVACSLLPDSIGIRGAHVA
jgi:hypothetical protein